MTGLTSVTALAALLPAMVGPLPVEQARNSLIIALCGGGEIELALEGEEGSAPPLATTPCCAKGCRSSSEKRRGIDPRQ